jgi:hypothetical protein
MSEFDHPEQEGAKFSSGKDKDSVEKTEAKFPFNKYKRLARYFALTLVIAGLGHFNGFDVSNVFAQGPTGNENNKTVETGVETDISRNLENVSSMLSVIDLDDTSRRELTTNLLDPNSRFNVMYESYGFSELPYKAVETHLKRFPDEEREALLKSFLSSYEQRRFVKFDEFMQPGDHVDAIAAYFGGTYEITEALSKQGITPEEAANIINEKIDFTFDEEAKLSDVVDDIVSKSNDASFLMNRHEEMRLRSALWMVARLESYGLDVDEIDDVATFAVEDLKAEKSSFLQDRLAEGYKEMNQEIGEIMGGSPAHLTRDEYMRGYKEYLSKYAVGGRESHPNIHSLLKYNIPTYVEKASEETGLSSEMILAMLAREGLGNWVRLQEENESDVAKFVEFYPISGFSFLGTDYAVYFFDEMKARGLYQEGDSPFLPTVNKRLNESGTYVDNVYFYNLEEAILFQAKLGLMLRDQAREDALAMGLPSLDEEMLRRMVFAYYNLGRPRARAFMEEIFLDPKFDFTDIETWEGKLDPGTAATHSAYTNYGEANYEFFSGVLGNSQE